MKSHRLSDILIKVLNFYNNLNQGIVKDHQLGILEYNEFSTVAFCVK